MPSTILKSLLHREVPVTAAHIENGRRVSVETCPVALALREATGERFCVFGTDAVPVKDFHQVRQKRLHFAKCVSIWISEFDQGLPVPPILLRMTHEADTGKITAQRMPLILTG